MWHKLAVGELAALLCKQPLQINTPLYKRTLLARLLCTASRTIQYKHINLVALLFVSLVHPTMAVLAASGSAPGTEPVIEMYMHDVLGDSSLTARPFTGLLGNIYSGQVPFARPIGFLPPKNGVAIPNANGAIPTINERREWCLLGDRHPTVNKT